MGTTWTARVIAPPGADKAAFQQVVAPTYTTFVKANGEDLIKAIQAVK